MYTLFAGTKIKFEYDLDTLFNIVSNETLTLASKTERDGQLLVDEIGLSDDERDVFDQFISEGYIKIFQKLLKMTGGIPNSIKLIINESGAVSENVKQKMTVTISGNDGSLNIIVGNFYALVLYDETIFKTTLNFVTEYATEFLAMGIVLTRLDDQLIFEAVEAGVPFTEIVVGMEQLTMTGVVVMDTENVTSTGIKKISCEVKDKAGYNANYLPIIDGEIFFALKNFVLKEWYVKCMLGDQAKYYLEKYMENMRAIQRYGLSLRKSAAV